MRCLNCQQDGLSTGAEVCPHCRANLAALFRDLLTPGTLLHAGKYRIEYPLGKGGFGITYRATHMTLDQPVAIKEFFPAEHAVRSPNGPITIKASQGQNYEQSLQRFMREGRVLAQLRHDNVVRVHDLFEEHGTGYLVMELVSGKSLREELDILAGNCLSPQRTEIVAAQLVGALDTLHAHGIYHLDIKPENILLTAGDHPILIDFGAAHQGLGTRSIQSFTLEYAAPEVLAGEKVGAESDLFELGMTLYEMLTGKRAPSAVSRLTDADGWAPRELQEPWRARLASALKIRRQDRPSSVTAWWNTRDVKQPSDTSHKEITPTPIEEPELKQRSKKIYLAIGAVALVLAIMGVYWFWVADRSLVPFRKGDKFGFSDTKGNLKIQPKYDQVEPFNGSLARVLLNDKSGFIDKQGREVVPLNYESMSNERDDYFVRALTPVGSPLLVKRNNKKGFIDQTGREIVPLIYDDALPFTEGLAVVTRTGENNDSNNARYGFVDLNGKEVVPPSYEDARPFREGVAAVMLNGKWGFIDKTGKVRIPLKYDAIDSFVNGFAYVVSNDKCGYIDKSGNETVPLKYESTGKPGDKLFELIDLIFAIRTPANRTLLVVKTEGKIGYVDGKGAMVIAPVFDEGVPFMGEFAAVKRGDKWGFIDSKGVEVIPVRYDSVSLLGFRDGLAGVKLNGKWGFIDTAGNVVIAFKFDSERKLDFGPIFREGLAAVAIDKAWGYIDTRGRQVIPLKYNDAGPFIQGLAEVILNDKKFFIDKNGTEFYQP
jgi:serine/threonine protein kinase